MEKNKKCRICKKEEKYVYPSNVRLPYCRECFLNKCRKWYLKNRLSKIGKIKKSQKENNYKSEKTKKQRKIRSIKRRTRKLFLLKGKICEFCKNNATEHHHHSIPIQYDKFNYVCHQCHVGKNRELKRRYEKYE